MASLLLQICAFNTQGQQQSQDAAQPEQQEQNEDVIRISTDLVQTGVSVFDKKGRFVEGLKKEDFELKVDGRAVEVGFFERVVTGTVNEEAQLAAARGGNSRPQVKETAKDTATVRATERGRVIIFFVDDVHIAPDSLKRAKDSILRFIDKEMGQNDLVAIASTSGQIGFLQQYTNNKEVLRRAVSRLSYRFFSTRDMEVPVMTDGHAVLIDRGDPDVTGFFVAATAKMLGITGSQAASIVRQRARMLLQQSAAFSKATLSSLENLARRSAALPGRKLIFFISDGFPLDTRNSDTLERIRSVVDASARTGVVIYSMDARGLVTDMMDATVEAMPNPRAASAMRGIGEDVLNALAADTGGRFIHNTNFFDPDIRRALAETSNYYLLAWRPDEEGGGKKFRRIQVSIKNRPELSVKVQRGYFNNTSEAKEKATTAKAPADPLGKAINSLFPRRELPTQLALNYIDSPGGGPTLITSMKIEGGALRFERKGDKTAAIVDIAGTIFNAEGKVVESYRHRLTATPPASATDAQVPDIIYNYRASLKPGLYQVRVAAHDLTGGKTGSAVEWMEIPDLSKQGFSMSSLILGERKPAAEEKKSDTLVEDVTISVDRRFERSSNLRFLVYIYRAASARPDVTLQVQIFRDGQPVVTIPPRQLSTEAQDLTHLAYAAEIPLKGLSAGQYVLQVTAIDNIAKANATQKVSFKIQ